jgi:primosomal protein N' (replication factor Y)
MATHWSHFIEVAVPRPLDQLFTYGVTQAQAEVLRPGSWVKISFGRTNTHAFVIQGPRPRAELTTIDPQKVKLISEVGSTGQIFDEGILELAKWAREYYRSPLGEILQCAAPAAALGLRTAKQEAREWKEQGDSIGSPVRSVKLNQEQMDSVEFLHTHFLESVEKKEGTVALLEGVTGSGKTEVYLELARKALALGKSVLILVPEIALTPQLHERFEAGLGQRIGLWHSAVSSGQRRDQFAALLQGKLKVVVGARSAVFAPLQNLGVIIVDEEHDPSYKQDDRVRYHARDLAVVRAKRTGALLVLGSATPSLETAERAREGRYLHSKLTQRASGGGMPEVELVDLKEELMVEGLRAPLAQRTLDAIRETLSNGKQVIVYLNRRGFAASLVCEDCGEVAGCPNCSVSLTFHQKLRRLRCHTCGYQQDVPEVCSKCSGLQFTLMGAGTESLELELPALLPEAKILRLDRDQVTSATRLDRVLSEFREGKANLMVGTQMLVKGHDFPNVTLVVVILADALFRWPDFRASERAYQILTQVSGRAGRGAFAGRVLIQTYQPDYPVLRAVKGELPFDEFMAAERETREVLRYPPFGRLARLRIEAGTREQAQQRAQDLKGLIETRIPDDLEVLGPSEAFMEKAKSIFRWDLLLRSKEIRPLHRAIHLAQSTALTQEWPMIVDVDPIGMG